MDRDDKRFRHDAPGARARRGIKWEIPPDKMERAIALHRGGRSGQFIFRALYPDREPCSEQTFIAALGDLMHDLDRLALMRDFVTGEHGEYIEQAIAGETVLPSDLAKSRDALLESQDILLRRLRREGDDGMVKDVTSLAGGICNVAGKLLALQRYRIDVAIIKANMSEPEQAAPAAPTGPAVVIDFNAHRVPA